MPVWFRRFRMKFDLMRQTLPEAPLPAGYSFVGWRERWLEAHARVKFLSFENGADTAVFPSLGSENGCLRLMRDITTRDGFLPETCWLLICDDQAARRQVPCGTIQGIRSDVDTGAIQNIGVVPKHRGRGLGSCLIAAALTGFRSAGLRWGTLEVTARNPDAVRLYTRLGFQLDQVIYKPGNVAPM